MVPPLRCRAVSPADGTLCADWLIRDCIHDAALGKCLAATLAVLFAEERMKGIVVESYDSAADRWSDQGIGLSGFTHESIMDRHLAGPRPYLLQSVLCNAAKGSGPSFLGPDEQARANAGAGKGLDVLGHWMQRPWDITDPLCRAVGSVAHTVYVRDHSGYRLHRLMHEDWVREFDVFVTFGYMPHSRFKVSELEKPAAIRGYDSRMLYFMDTHHITKVAPGTTTSFVLQYSPPVCHFTRAEQRLLSKALEGLTDQQIAESLDLSLNTLKSTWRSIYERVQMHAPHVLGSTRDDLGAGVRGGEKRRNVLTFAEAHPQELRPYAR